MLDYFLFPLVFRKLDWVLLEPMKETRHLLTAYACYEVPAWSRDTLSSSPICELHLESVSAATAAASARREYCYGCCASRRE